MNVKIIKNIEFLFEEMAPWRRNSYWDGCIFRGQGDDDYKLIPSILRPGVVENLWNCFDKYSLPQKERNSLALQIDFEYFVLREFYKICDMQGLRVPASESLRNNLILERDTFGSLKIKNSETWLPYELYEAAALAQHYGVPTRLLDWSFDPYIALYFAITSSKVGCDYFALFAFNKESFLHDPNRNEVNIDFVNPHYELNPNLSAQKGTFTLVKIKRPSLKDQLDRLVEGKDQFSVDREPLEELISRSNLAKKREMLWKFVIPSDQADKGLHILKKMGYSTAKIFPGYEGAAKQLLESRRS